MTIGRRSLLLGGLAPLFPANCFPATGFPLAICSETFAGSSFEDACKGARAAGYGAIEIEPAQLATDPAALSKPARQDARQAMSANALRCVGLHSFLKAPAGLHLTAPDAATRRKSWEYFARLIDLARDLTDRPLMILGSSKQRAAIDGATPQEAIARLIEGLHSLAPHAAKQDVTILVEPLAPQLCNVINTLAEAMEVVRAVNSPAVQTMFDCHNTAAEKEPLDALIRKYLPHLRHVHLNEMDGRRPGSGDFPFEVLLRALKSNGYHGFVSVEVFDFKPDGLTVARLANEYLQRVESNIFTSRTSVPEP
jgi:D-psicose/D-tagatose/L-ribulose 3-epimerase